MFFHGRSHRYAIIHNIDDLVCSINNETHTGLFIIFEDSNYENNGIRIIGINF